MRIRRLLLAAFVATLVAAPVRADQTGRQLVARGADGALHRYRFDRVLGSGWSATGYLAHDEETTHRVVIKVQSQKWLDDGKAETLTEEAALLRAVGGRHPGLPRALGLGRVADGRPALVMEEAPGRALWDYAAGPLGPRRAARMIAAVLRTVAALHARGYKHNDLHPGNVFYDEATGTATLLDFGNATRIGDEFKIANDKYGPPEQRPDSPVSMKGDPTTDLYHAGGILAHLLTGAHPDPAHPGAIVAGIADKRLRAIVQRARDVDPRRRYRSAAEMLDALVPYL